MNVSSVKDVVTGGFCVGCGACAAATDGNIIMRVNQDGAYEADIDRSDAAAIALPSTVCPFSDASDNEDVLSDRFSADNLNYDKRIGYYADIYAGRILDEDRILGSSSGGLTGWLVEKLLSEGLVDGVIHVGAAHAKGGDRLFGYQVSYSAEDAYRKRKSIYYSVDMSEALLSVQGDGKRYAIVGIPCFVKAVRLLMRKQPEMGDQIKFLIGLVCGHMKTSGFAESLAWQAGVKPNEITNFDFRLKNKGESAKLYSFGAKRSPEEEWHTRTTTHTFGGDWGHGMFQLNACDYCDDIFAEGADVCFADAWLPQYDQDWRGTNVIVSRNKSITVLLNKGLINKEIAIETLSVEDAALSQAGNFRHRWDGLSVRLADATAAGRAVPTKRIAPGSIKVPYIRKMLVRLRQKMSQTSHRAFREAVAKDQYDHFRQIMEPMVHQMRKIYRIDKAIKRRRFLARVATWCGII